MFLSTLCHKTPLIILTSTQYLLKSCPHWALLKEEWCKKQTTQCSSTSIMAQSQMAHFMCTCSLVRLKWLLPLGVPTGNWPRWAKSILLLSTSRSAAWTAHTQPDCVTVRVIWTLETNGPLGWLHEPNAFIFLLLMKCTSTVRKTELRKSRIPGPLNILNPCTLTFNKKAPYSGLLSPN